MSQTHKLGTVATRVFTEDGTTHVQYHATRVVSFDSKRVTFRTGGWRTVTTKTRMNQACNQFDLGWGVCQRKGEWFVSYHAGEGVHILERPFNDSEITVPRHPRISAEVKAEVTAKKAAWEAQYAAA